MDNNDRRQRQNFSGYAGQQGTQFQPQGQHPVPPTSAPAGSRASTQSYPYPYGQDTQFAGSSVQQPYAGQNYGSEPQSQRGQQYSQYEHSGMYNVPGAGMSASQSQYGSVPQYHQQSRDSAIEVLSGGFGAVPQGQFYGVGGGQEGETGTPANSMAAQNMTSPYPPMAYPSQQAPVGREPISQPYNPAGMSEARQPASQAPYPQGNYGDQGSNDSNGVSAHYTRVVCDTNGLVKDGRLAEAAPKLLELLAVLVRYIDQLGLTRDILPPASPDDHKEMQMDHWEKFNNCWLVALQKQIDMMEEAKRSGHPPQPPQRLIEPDYLESMGDEIVKAADGIEKHGLVDYQMGLWEEEIVGMITRCLALWDELSAGSTTAQRASGPSSIQRRRP